MPVTQTKYKSIIDWGFIITGLFFLFFSEKYFGGDSIPRINAVKYFINEGRIVSIKYSLMMPLFSIPLYLIGKIFGQQDIFLIYFNYFILFITLILSYHILIKFFSAETLRLFLILVISASTFTNHVSYFYGELFSACLMFLGVVLTLQDKGIYGVILLALAVANQPGIILGILFFCLFICFSRKNCFTLLAPAFALLIIFTENYIKFGNIFITGYENDHGFKTIMPYSSLSGFSYPLFLGLISIIFSFGKGLLWFMPGLFLPYPWYGHGLKNDRSKLLIKSLLLIVVGLILFYSKWWAWYGGYFWGPRFFVFISFPASLILACTISDNRISILKSLGIISILMLSFWVGFNGANIGQRNLGFLTQNNYALEFLIWYIPEFSVLWKPFIDGLTLDITAKIHFFYTLSAFLWCSKKYIYFLFKSIYSIISKHGIDS